MLVIPWITVQSVNLLLYDVDLSIIRSLKRGVVEVGLKGEKGFVVRVSYGPSRSRKTQ